MSGHGLQEFGVVNIGGATISLVAIGAGIAAFFIALWVVKILRKRLLNALLSRAGIEPGIKDSLLSAFGFAGFIVSGLIAVVVMGGDLSSFAMIAGALSVGIGFGLQNIINNLVSGIILLFERPIKVGDWVNIAGAEGIVKQINIRSTEIETFAKAHVIIPNSTILSANLTNMTHRNRLGRVEVKVGAAYGSDVDKVRKTLLDIAAGHKLVLANPAPSVLLGELAASTMDFTLYAHLADVGARSGVASDLRAEIVRRFAKEKIEIPFPQLVVRKEK